MSAFMKRRTPDYPSATFDYDLSKGCVYCGYNKWRPGPREGHRDTRRLKCGLCGAEYNVFVPDRTAYVIKGPDETKR